MRRRWLKLVLAAAVLFLLVLILVPLFVNGAALKPTVQTRLASALGRSVTIGNLSFSLLHGSLIAKDIAIADDPAFSAVPFLRAGQLKVGVEVLPLLLHHQINVTGLTLDQPTIQLIQDAAGKWNFASVGAAHVAAGQPSAPSTLTVDELEIENGTATIAALPPNSRPAASPSATGGAPQVGNAIAADHPFTCSNLDLTVKRFSFAASFPFELSAKLPGDGALKLSGTAGPIAAVADETPFQATLHANHFDPIAAGLVEPSTGIAGILDLDADLRSDGATVSSSGKLKAERFKLARVASPSPEPVNIDYNVTTNLQTRAGHVSNVIVHAGPAVAHVTGDYRLTPSAVIVNLHLNVPGVPIDPMEKLLPAVGINVPAGSQLRGGTLTANLSVTGPATAATIAGPVQIENSTLTGFDLGSRIEGLNPFGNHTGGTEIKFVRATIHSTLQLTRIDNIDADLPQLGTATGSGTVSPSGDLDFKMVAILAPSNLATALGSLATKTVGEVKTAVTGIGGFLRHGSPAPARSNPNQGIPITITGTATNPVIRANLAAFLR